MHTHTQKHNHKHTHLHTYGTLLCDCLRKLSRKRKMHPLIENITNSCCLPHSSVNSLPAEQIINHTLISILLDWRQEYWLWNLDLKLLLWHNCTVWIYFSKSTPTYICLLNVMVVFCICMVYRMSRSACFQSATHLE